MVDPLKHVFRPGAMSRDDAAALNALRDLLTDPRRFAADYPMTWRVDQERIWAGLDVCALAGMLPQCPGFPGGDDTTNTITIINDCALTSSPGFSLGLVFNECDRSLYLYVDGMWCKVTLTCVTPSGTAASPGSSCVPGVCNLCTNPPHTWTTYVTGMTGSLSDLNGTWVLYSQGNCRWSAQRVVAGVTYYASFVLGTNNEVLGFVNLTEGLVMAVYASGVGASGDCCSSVALTLQSSDGDDGTGAACSACSAGTGTPLSWDLTLTGMTGIFAVFNGAWTVPQSGACTWQKQDGSNNTVTIVAFGTNGVDAYLQVELLPSGGGLLRYFQAANTLTNCCTPQTLTLDSGSTVGVGNGPATILALSSCDTGEDGAPPVLTALPECCPLPVAGSGGSGGGGVVTSCCTFGLPSTLYATFTGSLAALGRVPLNWTGTAWEAGVTACTGPGVGRIVFSCNAGTGEFRLSCSFGLFFFLEEAATTCTPFLWSTTGNEAILSPPCGTGPFTVTVRDT